MRRLINELSKLPSVGTRSAVRLAYHLLSAKNVSAMDLAEAIERARENVTFCESCFSLTENQYCDVCIDGSRDQSVICVVEKPSDVISIEQSGGYNGLYHVLHGLWSPLKGVEPHEVKIDSLVRRVKKAEEDGSPVLELILATGTTVEGDATALYIANALSEQESLKISRIAQGLPKGGELEYADELTLTHALEGRQVLAT